jgi:hypothetical protein
MFMHTGADSVSSFPQGRGSLKLSWHMESQLYTTQAGLKRTAFGVGPSLTLSYLSDNRDGYHERFLVESGKSIGPRIYHTGDVIYGGAMRSLHQSIANMDEARSALVRIKAEGGPSSFSYKNYQLPSRLVFISILLYLLLLISYRRASRQRLLLAAKELSMLCVPEGGMNYDWDITYIIDGGISSSILSFLVVHVENRNDYYRTRDSNPRIVRRCTDTVLTKRDSFNTHPHC